MVREDRLPKEGGVMNLPRFCLLLGGVASFAIVLLHLGLALQPQWYGYFGAGELVQLHDEGSRFTVLVTLGLALMFALWGLYALSGVGVIGPVPLLRAGLIGIGAIYVLRSLLAPSELAKALVEGAPLRFVVFSAGSLAAGLLYLAGTLA
jgi:putative oxidoreductase